MSCCVDTILACYYQGGFRKQGYIKDYNTAPVLYDAATNLPVPGGMALVVSCTGVIPTPPCDPLDVCFNVNGPFVTLTPKQKLVLNIAATTPLYPAHDITDPLGIIMPGVVVPAAVCGVAAPTPVGRFYYSASAGVAPTVSNASNGTNLFQLTNGSVVSASILDLTFSFDQPVNLELAGSSALGVGANEYYTMVTACNNFIAGPGSILASNPAGYPANTIWSNGNNAAFSFFQYFNVTQVTMRIRTFGLSTLLNANLLGVTSGWLQGTCP